MRARSLTHLSDHELLAGLAVLVAEERTTLASLLAHLAEVDSRRLFVPAGYPSMRLYWIEELHLSEDAAYKRIQAARATREFPAILSVVADGSVHLTGVVLLKPYLTRDNVDELLAAAAHKTKAEIERLLANRFPRTESMPLVQPISGTVPVDHQLVPEPVGTADESAPRVYAPTSVNAASTSSPRSRVTPVAPQRYELRLMIDQALNDLLEEARQLGPQDSAGDPAVMFFRAMKYYVAHLRKRKFAATDAMKWDPRYIPAHVLRAVWQRDGGQCTFVAASGHRCSARAGIEYDHIHPIARGGDATIENLRLRCSAHNQYAADCTFGAGFMDAKREQARHARAELDRGESQPLVAGDARSVADGVDDEAEDHSQMIASSLRDFGYSASEVRQAIEYSLATADDTLLGRMQAAFRFVT